MGKLKEKLLNNLTPEEQNDMFELSAFEYVELMEKYKKLFDDNGEPLNYEYEPTQAEIDEMEAMIKDYYESDEFKEYADRIAQEEIDAINDSVQLKYTDSDILYVLDGIAGPVLKGMIMSKLNDVWNTKNGIVQPVFLSLLMILGAGLGNYPIFQKTP